MSKTTKHVLGNQRGRIGNIVGRVVDGIQLYSAYSGCGHDKQSPKQMAHRKRFGIVAGLAYSLDGAVWVGLAHAASLKPMTSQRNIFIKKNIRCVEYDIATETVTVDYESLVVAEGPVPELPFSAAAFDVAGKVSVTFPTTTDSDMGLLAEDRVYVAVYSPVLKKGMLAIAERSDGSATLTLPANWSGKTVHVWGFVRTSVEESTHFDTVGIILNPGDCSPSSYLGSGTIG